MYASSAKFKVVVAGRRFGKSHYAAYEMIKHAMMNETEDGKPLTMEHTVYYIAPTESQAKRIMYPKLRVLAGYERNGGLIRAENTNDGWIELINGRRIYIKGADNPDSLRGVAIFYVVLDEYASMKPFVWDEIIQDALADVEGSALFIGTPKGKNHFYKLFQGAMLKPEHNERTGVEEDWSEWEAWRFSSDQNPFLTARARRRMFGGNRSKDTIRQEVGGEFVSGGAGVLHRDNFPIVDGLVIPTGNGVRVNDNEVSTYITVDLAGFKKQEGNKILRTDESVVAVTQTYSDRWFIREVKHGHWDVRETSLRIMEAVRRYPGARLGIEQGMAKNAVSFSLEDYMRKFGRYVHVELLKHNNTRKQDRIAWALQGRSERGLIVLVRGDWNDAFLEQVADFPDPLAHDDLIDAVAYVDQMAHSNFVDDEDIEEWQPLDRELMTY